MKKILGLLILIITTNFVYSQNFESDFQKYFQDNDTLNQRKILDKWEKSNSEDPELFVAYLNYYFNKSIHEGIIVSGEDPPENADFLYISDTAGNYAGYIGAGITYDTVCLKKGLEKITEGINLYPDRLDMRFGKIYVLGEIENWDSFTNEIIKAIDYSAKNNNQWLWTNNEKLKDAKNFFLNGIQDYQIQLYQTENDELLLKMREIANEILKYYPDHIESLSDLAITYLLTDEYDKALDFLLKAEQINPRDSIVMMNIAYAYKMKGDKAKAIEYYKKVKKCGDEQLQKDAKQEIKELRRKKNKN